MSTDTSVNDNLSAQIISFRCPNRPSVDSESQCRGLAGGISVSTIENHDFSAPFEDYRYCPDCRGFFKITISGKNDLPEIKILEKGEHIDFIDASDYFGLEMVEGRRSK